MRFISENPADMRPIWMSQNEIEVPDNLLRQFFQDYSLSDCRFFLWQMLSASVATENKNSEAGNGELIYFFENLIPAIEAMYLIVKTEPLLELGVDGKSNVSHQPDVSWDFNQKQVANIDPKELKQDLDKCSGRKMKKISRRLRRKSIWFKEKIDDPYRIVSRFIDGYSVEDFNCYLLGILESCSQNHFYQKASPADVLHFFENLESILNASYLIHRMFKLYGGLNSAVPRDQNHNEELTEFLQEFFSYKPIKQWKQDLSEIYNFSLSNQAAHLWVDWIDTLSIYTRFTKLVGLLYQITIIDENR